MHPHIIRMYEAIETNSNIYIVMEYVKSGTLFEYIVNKGMLQEDEARLFFQQIISGVEYCHRNMVVHRDLKPENLLLYSKCHIKIADFGLSNVMRDGHFLKTSCGSLAYTAPEVVTSKLYAGPEVDVWSCGVILYALLCGTLPFQEANLPNFLWKILSATFPLPDHLSALARDLILKILVVDPMDRITIGQIREHAWFKIRLPRYLAVPLDTSQQVKNIDEGILLEVTKMGFDKDHLIESLHNRIQNKATVSYYLLVDNRSRATGGGYLASNVQETMDHLHTSSSHMAVPNSLPGFPAAGGKWVLGLKFQDLPRELITELCETLRHLNVSWKKNGHYNIKCRYLPGRADCEGIVETEGSRGETRAVKFEIQFYKFAGQYHMDLQRVSGPLFLFLDFCAAFLAQTGVV
ncbi:serine/threonine protein kinase OSK1-like [Curcuma longa]|uniref:serine/threonine protein kinase OSK1-like n=1 Tax=Curcuma longa TaxID=136217 RepID=UPI003D9F6513